jgi:hypothetical protein
VNRILKACFLLCTIAFFLSQSVYAQDSGEVRVYRTQFLELRGKVKSVFERVERQGRDAPDYKLKIELSKEMFALTKLAHNLEEQTGEANLSEMKRGQDQNKTLLLIGQGCKALDFVLSALDNYVATEDRAFLSIAKDGNSLIDSVEKIL